MISLKNFTHYSLCQAINHPDKLAANAKEKGYTCIGITDYDSISGAIEFIQACKDENIKWIVGVTLSIAENASDKKSQTGYITLYAKNLDGWKSLIKIISAANRKEFFNVHPRIDLGEISKLGISGLVCSVGGLDSWLAMQILSTSKIDLYNCPTYEDMKMRVYTDWIQRSTDCLNELRNTFSDLYLESHPEVLVGDKAINDAVKYLSKKLNIPIIPVQNAHYLNKEDFRDHHILLCSGMKTTLKGVKDKLEQEDNIHLKRFFQSSEYYLRDQAEQNDNIQKLADSCETYNVFNNPKLPKFPDLNGKTSEEFTRELCREGWKKRWADLQRDKVEEYKQRIEYELKTYAEIGILDYFLIVSDFIGAAKARGELTGVGRGCLSEDNLIYLDNGHVDYINNIKIDQNVLCSDGLYRKVVDKFTYDCDEDLLKITCYYGDVCPLILTKDHKVLSAISQRPKNYDDWSETTKKHCKKIVSCGDIDFHEAQQLKIDDFLFFPKPNLVDDIPSHIDLSTLCNSQELRYDDNYVYHDIWNPLCKIIHKTKKHNRYFKLDSKFFYVLGIFVGDGWIRSNQSCDEVGFAFNSHDINRINFVTRFFENRGFPVHIKKHQDSQLIQLRIYNRFLKRLFLYLHPDYNFKSQSKHVPKIVFQSGHKNIRLYLTGYYAADGFRENNRIKYTTVSRTLAYQIKLLLSALNIPSGIKLNVRKPDMRKGFKNCQTPYIINAYIKPVKTNKGFIIRNDGILYRIRNITTAKYHKVYDLKIEEKHNYTTTNCCVHNSAGGCMLAYLLEITELDPVKYNLSSSRFYNPGRNTKEKTSMPDIDCDLMIDKREDSIQYLKEKYGLDRIGQVVTYGRLQGRGALKEVLRINDTCGFEMINRITEHIPDEAKIADDLQEMEERGEQVSIILWALQHEGKKLKDWCYLDDAGKCQGEYARLFEQAIRLEGTLKTQGRHAAAVILGSEALANLCPMLFNKSKEDPICGFEYPGLEAIGLVKFDLLGVAVLDKLNLITNMIKERYNGK